MTWIHTHRYSQYGQDKWLYDFFNNKDSGTFLDVGALDGVHCSNTLFFEEKGWTGICIEASPTNFNDLIKNRTCICEQAVLDSTIRNTTFRNFQGWGKGICGISDKYEASHMHRVESLSEHKDNTGDDIIEVRTELLNNVLDRHDIYHFDFAKIDTEGSELDILKGLDLEKYIIDVLLVENNYRTSDVESFLASNYVKHDRIGDDDVYLRRGYEKL